MCNVVYTFGAACWWKEEELVLSVGDLVLPVGGKEERIGAAGCCC